MSYASKQARNRLNGLAKAAPAPTRRNATPTGINADQHVKSRQAGDFRGFAFGNPEMPTYFEQGDGGAGWSVATTKGFNLAPSYGHSHEPRAVKAGKPNWNDQVGEQGAALRPTAWLPGGRKI